MISKTATLSLAALAALAGSSAFAADLPPRQFPAAVPVLAQQPTGGIYFVSRTGIGAIDDTSFALAGGAVRVGNSYEAGLTSFFGLGYSFGPVLGGLTPRVEVEGFYGTFSVDTHTVSGTQVPSLDSFGELRAFGGFASGYLDLNLGGVDGMAAITPFIGGGVGMASVKLRRQGVSATGVVLDDEDSRFAYHLSAGVGINLSRLGFGANLFDRSTLELGYRFMQVPDLRMTSRDGTTAATELTSNMFTVGFRRQF
jgi:opacity protein-like surface antigen